MTAFLNETRTFDQANILVESDTVGEGDDKRKRYYMQGCFIEGDVRNMNERVYPSNEIQRAVSYLQERIQKGDSITGELDHPDTLTVNLDRISHVIEKMWTDGNKGMGRLRILSNLPCGKIAQGLLEEGIKMGVSSRGSGSVNESNGRVQDYEIVTVDLVMQPSAPSAYPTTIYESRYREFMESMMNSRAGNNLFDVSQQATFGKDRLAEKHFQKELLNFIQELKVGE